MAWKGARVTKSADETGVNYTTITALSFNTESVDTDGFHDNVTNNSRLTVPSGVSRVRLAGQVALNNISSSQTFTVDIRKNGAAVLPALARLDQIVAGSGNDRLQIFSSAIVCSAGDYFELRFSTNSDTSIDITTNSWFEIEEVPDPSVAYSGALVKKSADQTTANYSSVTAIAWNTESHDVGGWHDNVTNNTRMTVPSGVSRVRLTAQVGVTAFTADSALILYIYKNNALTTPTNINTKSIGSGDANPSCALVSYVDSCTAGDYYEVRMFCGDSSITVVAAQSWFSIEKVE